MATKPKILIALTAQRMVFTRCAASIFGLAKKADYEAQIHIEMGCDIASQRNNICNVAKEKGHTHILFVDYDMVFTPADVQALIDHDKEIVGAAYNKRSEPIKSTATPVEGEDTSKLFKCESIGAGLLLIKTSALDKLQQPYFLWGYDKNGLLVCGEDTYFVQKAKAAGVDTWADPNLSVKHIAEALI